MRKDNLSQVSYIISRSFPAIYNRFPISCYHIFKKESIISLLMLFAPLLGVSQTGPGGVKDVTGTSSMVLWMDASQNVTTSGGNVTDWSDLSGYENHATSPGIPNRPALNRSGNKYISCNPHSMDRQIT